MATLTDDQMRALMPTTKIYSVMILKAGPNRQMAGCRQHHLGARPMQLLHARGRTTFHRLPGRRWD